MVLCESTVNFQSSTPQGRSRPTLVVMPLPESESKRGCGRSGAPEYLTGCCGALGRCNSCGTLRNSFQAVTISSGLPSSSISPTQTRYAHPQPRPDCTARSCQTLPAECLSRSTGRAACASLLPFFLLPWRCRESRCREYRAMPHPDSPRHSLPASLRPLRSEDQIADPKAPGP